VISREASRVKFSIFGVRVSPLKSDVHGKDRSKTGAGRKRGDRLETKLQVRGQYSLLLVVVVVVVVVVSRSSSSFFSFAFILLDDSIFAAHFCSTFYMMVQVYSHALSLSLSLSPSLSFGTISET
jgi:hypothetical protein